MNAPAFRVVWADEIDVPPNVHEILMRERFDDIVSPLLRDDEAKIAPPPARRAHYRLVLGGGGFVLERRGIDTIGDPKWEQVYLHNDAFDEGKQVLAHILRLAFPEAK